MLLARVSLWVLAMVPVAFVVLFFSAQHFQANAGIAPGWGMLAYSGHLLVLWTLASLAGLALLSTRSKGAVGIVAGSATVVLIWFLGAGHLLRALEYLVNNHEFSVTTLMVLGFIIVVTCLVTTAMGCLRWISREWTSSHA